MKSPNLSKRKSILLFQIIAVFTFYMLSGLSRAGALSSTCAGSNYRFAGVIVHGVIGPDATHNNYTVSCTDPLDMNKEKWKITASFKETEKGINNNDIFAITAGNVEHTIAPDLGEQAGNKVPLPGIGIKDEAGKGGLKLPGAVTTDLALEKKAHGNHEDRAAATMLYFIDPNTKDINGYQYTTAGRHVDPNAKMVPGGGALNSQGAAELFGSFSFLIDPDTGEFDLAVAISNLVMADISLARIRAGTQLLPGATLFDLMPSLFQDLSALATSRLILGGLFPPREIERLLAGGAYIEIVTPNGTLTGPLVAIDEPSAGLLLAIGTLAIVAVRWRSPYI